MKSGENRLNSFNRYTTGPRLMESRVKVREGRRTRDIGQLY